MDLGVGTLFSPAPDDNPIASQAKLKFLRALRIRALGNGIGRIYFADDHGSQPVGRETGTTSVLSIFLGVDAQQRNGCNADQSSSCCLEDLVSHIPVRRLRRKSAPSLRPGAIAAPTSATRWKANKGRKQGSSRRKHGLQRASSRN